jgi:hypothetical protein
VENNIVWKARHSLIFEGGGSGCVYGYNYCQDVFGGEDPQFLHGDMDTHGAHPYMNLFESNVFSKLAHDNTFGSSSHNTTFRCNITRWSANATRGFAAVVIEATSHDQNLVGNVLGKPGISGVYEITSDPGSAQGIYKMGYDSPGGIGSPVSSMPANTVYRHGNFDYITNTTKWETSNPDHTIPASLYLSSKPAFFGSNPWPAIGSDLTPMVSKLPAQIRFEQIQAGGVVAPSNAAIIIQTSP